MKVLILGLFCFLVPVGADSHEKDALTVRFAPRLVEMVPKIRQEKKLVGLAAMIMMDGKVVATAVDGERKKGGDGRLSAEDRWHVGSITKSMTATMIGRLVEKGTLKWTTTMGECFGSSLKMHDDWRSVTLEQLLTHTAGAPANLPIHLRRLKVKTGPPRVAARREAIELIVANPPQTKPGKAFAYSNVGFTIAGAMAEKESGKTWEQLMAEELFEPLKLRKAGFGPPRSTPASKQPHGHQNFGPFKRTVSQEEDNSPIIGPAGTVHMSLQDLCRYGHEHLIGERGKSNLLKSATFAKLHRPRLDDYACGWIVPQKNPWTTGRIIWHNGSNTYWFALLVILPERNAVIAVTSNDGDIRGAQSAAFQIVADFDKAHSKSR